MKNRIIMVSMFAFILLNASPVFPQGGSLSPSDLKGSYIEKRASFERNGTKLISTDNQQELNRIVEVLKVNAPNSYEYHYVTYVNSNFDGSVNSSLLAAYKLKPDAREINVELFGYYELIGDYQKSKEFANSVKSGFSNDQIAYYKHLMANESAPYTVFSGERDAYAVLALQRLGEITSKSNVINLDFLQNEAYREKIEKEFGIKSTIFLGNESKFLAALVNKNPGQVVISTTVHQSYLAKFQAGIYLTGLTYRTNPTSQLAELERFWSVSKQFLISTALNTQSDKTLYQNFLPPLLTLYKLKKKLAITDSDLNKSIEIIALKINMATQVHEILKAYDQIE